MARAKTAPESEVQTEVREIIQDMRAAVASSETPWFLALTEAVRRWPLPFERVGDRDYRYLIGGEAFDWLLLAERLLDELDGLVPEDEADALIYREKPPLDLTEADFQQLLGAKYKPHLNFVYGVRTEAALLVAVGEEVRKEQTASRIWDRNGHVDDQVFTRIYSRERDDLLAEFRTAMEVTDDEWMSLADLSEWHYWLFQYRVKFCDPAKVASDTRKGLALLQKLELAALRRAETPAE